jgi:hypothetical protein
VQGASVSTFAGLNGYESTSAHTLTVSGSLLGVPVIAATASTTLSPTSYAFFNPSFAGPIDTIKFTTSGGVDTQTPAKPGGFFLFDNFTYTDVPEPGALALLGVGGLICLRRRTR